MKRLLFAVLCVLTLLAACTSIETDNGIEKEQLAAAGSIPPRTAASEEPEPVPTATKASVPAPAPVITPVPEPVSVKVIAAGDLMCLYAQLGSARKNGKYEFDYAFAYIKDTISAADIAIGNLETPVAEGYKLTGPSPEKGSPKVNAPESYLSAVAGCGFDVLVNANNHIYDCGAEGLDKTISSIDKYGIRHTGAYGSGRQREPLVLDAKGVRIAVMGYTDHINGRPKNPRADMYSEQLVSADIGAARGAGADLIIVYMHWGNENTRKLTRAQSTQAEYIASAGADIIIGSHPHCLQSPDFIETERGAVPVFYSLGNLVSSMGRTMNRDSALVNIVVEKDLATGEAAIVHLTYTPTLCSSTEEGNWVILPADTVSVSQSNKSKALSASRERTVKVMGDTVAQPE